MRRPVVISLDGLGDEFVLTVDDLACILQISHTKAWRMLAEGDITGAFRVGNRIRIRVEDLRAWIKSERLPRNPIVHDIRESFRRRSGGKGNT